MTAASIVSLILGLVKLANFLFGWLHDNEKIQEGEDRQIAKALAEMAARSTTIKQVESIFAKMPPADVVKEIEKNADFRD